MTLQWGRSAVAAETCFQRLLSRSVQWLQWGRGCNAAETELNQVVRRFVSVASMEPQRSVCGNVIAFDNAVNLGVASMGPQPEAAET